MERTRATVAAAGLLALLAVVATASRTRLFHEAEPPVSAGAAHLLVDFAAYLFIGVLLLSCAIMVWALWPREGYDGPQAQRRSFWQTVLQTVMLVVAMSLLVGAIMARRSLFSGHSKSAGSSGGAGLPTVITGAPGTQTPPAIDWAAFILVLATLLVIAFAVWRSMRRRRVAAAERRALARELKAVVDDSLEDLRLDDDPRRAVIQAYARMERVLRLHGVGRRQAETPHEYLGRALRSLQVTPAALERLTRLFEEARFSVHDISPAMRADAVDALAQLRDELTQPQPEPTRVLHVAG